MDGQEKEEPVRWEAGTKKMNGKGKRSLYKSEYTYFLGYLDMQNFPLTFYARVQAKGWTK